MCREFNLKSTIGFVFGNGSDVIRNIIKSNEEQLKKISTSIETSEFVQASRLMTTLSIE
jgi:hypothetical protein